MPIKYSLSASLVAPKGKAHKVFPRAQYQEIVTLPQLARHVQEHGSPFTRDIIVGVISATVDCLREQLLKGNKVDLGDLGSFHLLLHSDGVDKAEYFDPRLHVSDIETVWEPSLYFRNLKDDPTLRWEYALTRKEMAQAMKQARQEADEAVDGTHTHTTAL